MRLLDVCLIRPQARPGELPARLGVPLLDEYLRFVAGRCRPNTVLAAAYDLKVFFTVVGKQPEDVQPTGARTYQTHVEQTHRGAFLSSRTTGLITGEMSRKLHRISSMGGAFGVRAIKVRTGT